MLRNFILLRSQRNRVYEILREAGLEPSEFAWSKEKIAGVLLVSRLNHKDGTYYFQFSSHEVNSWCLACPGRFRWVEYEYPKNWEEQEDVFRRWVSSLKRELEAPDPWEELEHFTASLGVNLGEPGANEPIPAVEADQIGAQMARLGDRIVADFQLGEQEAAAVRSRLDYLAAAARRQRSRDWVHMVIGACATMAIACGLPREKMGKLWELIRGQLNGFIHMPVAETPAAVSARRSRIAAVKAVFSRGAQRETSPPPQP